MPDAPPLHLVQDLVAVAERADYRHPAAGRRDAVDEPRVRVEDPSRLLEALGEYLVQVVLGTDGADHHHQRVYAREPAARFREGVLALPRQPAHVQVQAVRLPGEQGREVSHQKPGHREPHQHRDVEKGRARLVHKELEGERPHEDQQDQVTKPRGGHQAHEPQDGGADDYHERGGVGDPEDADEHQQQRRGQRPGGDPGGPLQFVHLHYSRFHGKCIMLSPLRQPVKRRRRRSGGADGHVGVPGVGPGPVD